MVSASPWSVALRTFYRQILSLLYSSFFFWNFRPRLARELIVYYAYVNVYVNIFVYVYVNVFIYVYVNVYPKFFHKVIQAENYYYY